MSPTTAVVRPDSMVVHTDSVTFTTSDEVALNLRNRFHLLGASLNPQGPEALFSCPREAWSSGEQRHREGLIEFGENAMERSLEPRLSSSGRQSEERSLGCDTGHRGS